MARQQVSPEKPQSKRGLTVEAANPLYFSHGAEAGTRTGPILSTTPFDATRGKLKPLGHDRRAANVGLISHLCGKVNGRTLLLDEQAILAVK